MLQLEIVTPTKTLDQGEVDYLRCPSPDGLFGLMAGHAAVSYTHLTLPPSDLV